MTTPTLPPGFTARNTIIPDIPTVVELLNAYNNHHLQFQGTTLNMVETDGKLQNSTRKRIYTWYSIPREPLQAISKYGRYQIRQYTLGCGYVYSQMPITKRLVPTCFIGEMHVQSKPNRCPEDVRVAYRSGTGHTIKPTKQLLTSCGMQLIRHSFKMLIEWMRSFLNPFTGWNQDPCSDQS